MRYKHTIIKTRQIYPFNPASKTGLYLKITFNIAPEKKDLAYSLSDMQDYIKSDIYQRTVIRRILHKYKSKYPDITTQELFRKFKIEYKSFQDNLLNMVYASLSKDNIYEQKKLLGYALYDDLLVEDVWEPYKEEAEQDKSYHSVTLSIINEVRKHNIMRSLYSSNRSEGAFLNIEPKDYWTLDSEFIIKEDTCDYIINLDNYRASEEIINQLSSSTSLKTCTIDIGDGVQTTIHNYNLVQNMKHINSGDFNNLTKLISLIGADQLIKQISIEQYNGSTLEIINHTCNLTDAGDGWHLNFDISSYKNILNMQVRMFILKHSLDAEGKMISYEINEEIAVADAQLSSIRNKLALYNSKSLSSSFYPRHCAYMKAKLLQSLTEKYGVPIFATITATLAGLSNQGAVMMLSSDISEYKELADKVLKEEGIAIPDRDNFWFTDEVHLLNRNQIDEPSSDELIARAQRKVVIESLSYDLDTIELSVDNTLIIKGRVYGVCRENVDLFISTLKERLAIPPVEITHKPEAISSEEIERRGILLMRERERDQRQEMIAQHNKEIYGFDDTRFICPTEYWND